MDWVLHCQLVVERGLIKGKLDQGQRFTVYSITWEGYDFLDNSRSPEVWNAAKKAAGHMSFTVFCSVLTKLTTDYGLGLLKSQFPDLLEFASGLAGGGGEQHDDNSDDCCQYEESKTVQKDQ